MNKKLKDLDELESWFHSAIEMNRGVFLIGKKEFIYEHKSLGCISHQNIVRVAIVKLIHSKWFGRLTLAVIIS